MNKIIRDHYPVEKLPADLRQGFSARATVRVVIEEEPVPASAEPLSGGGKMTIADTLEMIRAYHALARPSVSSEEAVARIRALRDEWDD